MLGSEVLRSCAVGAGVGCGLWLLGVCIYRLWFHPLAKYPGPFWGRLTDGYAAYRSWRGDLHLDMWRCHEEYGDYVRYSPNRLLFNTATALDSLYTSGKQVQKSKGYLSMMARVPNTITQQDKALHAQQRRLLGHGFSDAALRTYETPVDMHVKNFCDQLSQKLEDVRSEKSASTKCSWSNPENMACMSDYLTFDIMLDVIYGSKSEMVNKADNRSLLSAIALSNIRVGVMIPLHKYKGTFLDMLIFKSAIVARYNFIGFIRKLLLDKSAEKKTQARRKSVYDMLMTARDGDGLTPVEIAAESTNLILAGFDTTSTVLAASLFYMSRFPEVYDRVASEVRSTFFSASNISKRPMLNSCTYLRACIDETMRMAPPVAASPFREVEAGGVTVDGHNLPAGCDVGTGIYAIHHNPAYFPDPFTFNPDRWLTGKDDDAAAQDASRRAYSAFTPFGRGSRSCVGKGLAIMELMSILAHLLYRFDFKMAEGEEGKLGAGVVGATMGRHRVNEYQLYDHVTAAKDGPMLQFRARRFDAT